VVENKKKNLSQLQFKGDSKVIEEKENEIEENSRNKLKLTGPNFIHEVFTNIDRVAPLASSMSTVVNWITNTGAKPRLIRKFMEKFMGKGTSLL
jgi:hypothetical protein